MEINMNENFHSVVGFVILRENYPSFAMPYFVDRKGNYCIQTKTNGEITKRVISFDEIKIKKGLHQFNGVSYLEKDFYKKEIFAFAYSDTNFCIGCKNDVDKFLTKTFKKHKRKIKKANLLEEIVEFVFENRHDKTVHEEIQKEEESFSK